MAAIKTKQTEVDVHEFINTFAVTEQRRKDSFELLQLMQEIPATNPKCGVQPLSDLDAFITSLTEANKREIGLSSDSRHVKLLFLFMYIQEAKNTNIY